MDLKFGRPILFLRGWRAWAPISTIRSSIQLVVGTAFLQLGIFVAGLLVARAEGPEAFGLYSAAFALGSAIVGGGTAGLPVLVLRRASEGDLDRALLARAAGIQLSLVVPAVIVTAALGAAILGGLKGALSGGAAGLLFAIINVARLGQNVHSGRRRYHRAAATEVLAGTLFPLLTHVALRLNTGIVGSLAAIAVAWAISCSIAWTRLPDLTFHRTPSRLRLMEGISFTALGLVYTGYGRVDTVIAVPVAGAVAAGYYSAAYRLIGPFQLVGSAFSTLYFSRLCEYNSDRERWMTVRRRGTIALVGLSLAGMAVLFVATPFIIRVFYGPAFQSAVGPARILLLSILPWSLWLPKASELASVRLEKRVAAALASGIVLDVFLIVLLGDRFGASGMAWAWVFSQSAVLLLLAAMARGISGRDADIEDRAPRPPPVPPSAF